MPPYGSTFVFMFSILRLPVISLLVVAAPLFAQTDSTVRMRHTMTLIPSAANVENPTVVRSAYYVHSTMRRIDSVDATGKVTFTKINNCATRSGLIIDPSSREYRAVKLPRLWTDEELRDYISKHPANAVRIESRTVDTGERRVMLGLTAKHLVTTVERATLNGTGGTETIDAWYVEHQQVECDTATALPEELSGALLLTYPELADVHHVGPFPMGLAVQVGYTIKWIGDKYGAGGKTMTGERVVESISSSPLDPKTFEIPAGFRENPDLLKPRYGSIDLRTIKGNT